MAGFRLEYTFYDGAYIEIDGNRVKYWIMEGLPDFEGDLDGFAKTFPLHMEVLFKSGLVRIAHSGRVY